MKKTVLLSYILVLMLSCSDKGNDFPNYGIDYRPRNCSFVYIIPGEQTSEYDKFGNRYVYNRSDLENNSVNSDNLIFSVQTANYDRRQANRWITVVYFDDRENLDEHIPFLEQQIERDYSLYMKSLSMKTDEYEVNELPQSYASFAFGKIIWKLG